MQCLFIWVSYNIETATEGGSSFITSTQGCCLVLCKHFVPPLLSETGQRPNKHRDKPTRYCHNALTFNFCPSSKYLFSFAGFGGNVILCLVQQQNSLRVGAGSITVGCI